MIADWKAFLQQQGADIADDVVQHFGEPEQQALKALQENTLMDLSHQGLLAVSGEDSVKFLQGQLTCDVSSVTADSFTLGACCTPKGRMLSNFLLTQWQDTYYLAMDRGLVSDLKQHLSKYAAFFKTELEDASERFVRLGIAGKQTPAILASLFDKAPAEPGEAVHGDDYLLLRERGQQPRFQLWLPPERAPAVWERLQHGAHPVGTPVWDLLCIQAGLGWVTPATRELFVPQMLNLQAVGALSFKKGCYTGQEIVARMQYLGKLKKRLYRAEIDIADHSVIASELFTHGKSSSVGQIVNAAPGPFNNLEVLAVIQNDAAQEYDIHLGSTEGPKLKLLNLPYKVEEARS